MQTTSPATATLAAPSRESGDDVVVPEAELDPFAAT